MFVFVAGKTTIVQIVLQFYYNIYIYIYIYINILYGSEFSGKIGNGSAAMLQRC